MSKFKVLTSFNIELDFEIPDFHKRMFAYLIDTALVTIYAILIGLTYTENTPRWIVLILWLAIPAYPLVTELTLNGQTIGKKILGIRVINEQGGNATPLQFVTRWLLRLVDLMLYLLIAMLQEGRRLFTSEGGIELLFLFGLVVADIMSVIITKKSQRLGDLAAGTVIIDLRTKAGLEETVFMEMEDNYVPLFPEVMRLSDRDLNIIKSVYSTVLKRNDYALAERTAEKIETALKIRSTQHPLTFLETLLKDYNYLSTR